MNENYLQHHGILGMKWGVRRYQNKDGTLTPEGRRHLGKEERKAAKKAFKEDVKDVAKKGLTVDYTVDRTTGKVTFTQARDSKERVIGEEYAQKVMTSATRRKTMKTLAASAAITTGIAFVSGLLYK